jgi:hypothetical protein
MEEKNFLPNQKKKLGKMFNLKKINMPELSFIVLMSACLTACGGPSLNYNPSLLPNLPVVYAPQNPNGRGPAPVSLSSSSGPLNPADLASAGNYVMMAKTGVSNVTGSSILGNIAVSPAAASYITGFSLIADSSNQFSTSSSVTGKIYAADYAPPTPSNLTTAIGNMETAYTDAAGRTTPDFNELATGNIGGLTLVPGLYTWTNTVIVPDDVYIDGGANDVWIFQIAGDVTMDAAKTIHLTGGAQAKNIFWQVAGKVDIGTDSHFEGIILAKTAVNLLTNASMNGRIYSQTHISLDNNAVTEK